LSRLSGVQALFALLGAVEAAIGPFLPLLFADRGLSSAAIGGVLALMSAVALVVNPAWGRIADRRFGAERALMVSAAGACLAAVGLALADGTVALAVAGCALWCFRAPFTTLSDAIALARLGSAGNADYGRIRLWMSIGWAIGAIAWGAVFQLGGVELVPVLYAIAVPLLAGWAWRQTPAAAHVHVPHDEDSRSAVRPLLAFLASLVLVMAAFGATTNFLSLRIEGLGGGLLVVGIAAGVQAAAEVPAMLWMRRLCDVFGRHGVYAAGCGCFALSFAAWAVLTDPVWVAVVKLVAGIGYALVYVGSVIIVDDLVPARLRASGQGAAKAVSFGLSPILGTAAGGLLYDLAGPRTMFIVAVVAVVAGAGVALAADRHPALVTDTP
jgi:MFS transporter, PPP family, 3-phenylpropionic acid transporter